MRLKKVWITMILICCSLLIFAACKQARVAQSISLNGYSAEEPLEICMGKFSYSGYTVSIVYDDGETEELPLTEDMIPETDKLKFFQEGKNSITITYKGATASVAIDVLRNEFPDNVQLNGFSKEYTGETFAIAVEGDIPGGTKIIYSRENFFQDVGEYDISAKLQREGYVSKELFAHVSITKANYELEKQGFTLEDAKFLYDKEAHGIYLKKVVESVYVPVELPQGVSVSYSFIKTVSGKGEAIPENLQQSKDGNKVIDAGVYTVYANFKGDEKNYNPIPSMKATLTITQAAYDLSKVEFLAATHTYSGEEYSLTISEKSKLPWDVKVFYEIAPVQDGKALQYKDGNSATDAGEYSVRATFKVEGENAENYKADPFYKEARLTILRATYDEAMKGVGLDTQCFTYEENGSYTIIFDSELPAGVLPKCTLKNGETEISGMMEASTQETETGVKTTYTYTFSVEEEGEYTCVVTFVHENANYEELKLQLTAWVLVQSTL